MSDPSSVQHPYGFLVEGEAKTGRVEHLFSRNTPVWLRILMRSPWSRSERRKPRTQSSVTYKDCPTEPCIATYSSTHFGIHCRRWSTQKCSPIHCTQPTGPAPRPGGFSYARLTQRENQLPPDHPTHKLGYPTQVTLGELIVPLCGGSARGRGHHEGHEEPRRFATLRLRSLVPLRVLRGPNTLPGVRRSNLYALDARRPIGKVDGSTKTVRFGHRCWSQIGS